MCDIVHKFGETIS